MTKQKDLGAATVLNAEPGSSQNPAVAWTPGPWVVHFDEPYLDRGARHYFLEDHEGHQLLLLQRLPEASPNEHDANARLIAAAPELYAQLEDAQTTLTEAAKLLADRYPSVANNIVNQCAIRCGDLLAKARGEA